LVASTGDLNFCIKMLAGTPSYASQVEQNLSWKSFQSERSTVVRVASSTAVHKLLSSALRRTVPC